MDKAEWERRWKKVDELLDGAETTAKSQATNKPLKAIALTIVALGKVVVIAVRNESAEPS